MRFLVLQAGDQRFTDDQVKHGQVINVPLLANLETEKTAENTFPNPQ